MELIGIVALFVVFYVVIGFALMTAMYYDATIPDQTFVGLIIIWPFVLLYRLWRGIVYVAGGTARAAHYVSKEK